MNKRMTISITYDTLVDTAFILFFSNTFVQMILNRLLGTGIMSEILTLFAIYTPLFLVCIVKPRRYFKPDFIVLYIAILAFFAISILSHPEYSYYYARDGYGIWDYVLLPIRGLYAYLFVRLMDSPERLTRNFRIAGWLMFIYFAYTLILSIQRGYWIGVVGLDGQARMTYSVSYGYTVLPFALTFLYYALKEKKMHEILAATVSLGMILAGGSRGAILFVGLFCVLYCFINIKNSKHKFRNLFIIIVLFFLLFISYHTVLTFIIDVLSRLGISSRFITSLLSGNIAEDNGRNRIWGAAIQMIKDNPWGYGAMGSQHVISKYIYAGYPHSVVLEFLIDFGVIFGIILLIILGYNAFSMLFSPQKKKWLPAFLPLFCSTCCLFISLTYWGLPSFWACIGISVNCIKEKNNKKRIRLLRRRFK